MSSIPAHAFSLVSAAEPRPPRPSLGILDLTCQVIGARTFLDLESRVLPALRSYGELGAIALTLRDWRGPAVVTGGGGVARAAVEAVARRIARGLPDIAPEPDAILRPGRLRLRGGRGWLIYLPLPGTPGQRARQRLRRSEPLVTAALDNIEEIERLRCDAVTDPLTGLRNRRLFDEALSTSLRERAEGGLGSVAVLSIDLDGFKRLNDRRGHAAGDAALKTVARLLGESTRESDLCARVGGDEFAILMREAGRPQARAAARRLAAGVAGRGVPGLGVSIGIATTPPLPPDPEVLGRAADAAMYRAKRRSTRAHVA